MDAKSLIEKMIFHNIFITVNYKDIAQLQGKNNYTYIRDADGKNGVYIFYKENGSTKEYLYIGENHTLTESKSGGQKWDLKERLKQHFVHTDNGSLLKKVAEKDKIAEINAKKNFIKDDVKLSYLPIENNSRNDIVAFQNILINEIKPKYNDYKK